MKNASEIVFILDGSGSMYPQRKEAVDSFNEQMVTLATSQGALTLLGSGLHVSHLNLEDGQLLVEGEIDALQYDSSPRARGSLLSRLMR